MAERYNPAEIETRWQQRWEEDRLDEAHIDPSKPKWYFLTMFPYTSGDLHIGHWYAEAPADAAARYRRMKGYNVLRPFGYDSFGLPAENAAIEAGVHPHTWTVENIARMRNQLKTMGCMFDWSKEVATYLPEYYRWNQWFFLQFYKRGLVYRAKAPANWCPHCQTVLANEQVENGACERCHTPVTRRDLDQWLIRITNYAEELLDFSQLQWPEKILLMQRNWIGRSEGVDLEFPLDPSTGSGQALEEKSIHVFTTRPDTVYGVTFMVLAPEHGLVAGLTTDERRAEVEAYVEQARRQTEIERTSTEREKTGVFIGAYCRNPFSGQRVPIFVADYALVSYGTGAVMGVPAHDYRDFAFAARYDLPVIAVIAPPNWQPGQALPDAFVGPGPMVNSGSFDGTFTPGDWSKLSEFEQRALAERWAFDFEQMAERVRRERGDGIAAVASEAERRGWGRRTVTYHLRDWLISRQRYWGTPIPVVYCEEHGVVLVPEDQLPVLLPPDAEFRPTGESPLASHEAFVNATCPQCGRPARRETDTMDTFVDSSWYFLRYINPTYDRGPLDPNAARYWLPVDQYTGGAEHAVKHLLYARFFWKVCRDLGLVQGDEPFARLFNQGIILAEDRQKMSKSRPEFVVAPDELLANVGADAVRAFLMFIGPWDLGGSWSRQGIQGISRWLQRVWSLVLAGRPHANDEAPLTDRRQLQQRLHQTIRKVEGDLEDFRFNTAIAALMEYSNFLQEARVESDEDWDEAIDVLLRLMAPFTPHIAEELWTRLGKSYSIHQQPFPAWDSALADAEEVTLVVQVNGRVRDRLLVPVSISESEARTLALQSERVRSHLTAEVERLVYVPGRLINIVTR